MKSALLYGEHFLYCFAEKPFFSIWILDKYREQFYNKREV